MVATVLAGALTLGAAFGLPVTALQVGAAGTFLSLVAGLFIRTQVVPVAKVEPIVPPTQP